MPAFRVFDSLGDGNCLFNSAVLTIAYDLTRNESDEKWQALISDPLYKPRYIELINRAKEALYTNDPSFPKLNHRASSDTVFQQFKRLFVDYDIAIDANSHMLQRALSRILRDMVATAAQDRKVFVRNGQNAKARFADLLEHYFDQNLEKAALNHLTGNPLNIGGCFQDFQPVETKIKELFKGVNTKAIMRDARKFDKIKKYLKECSDIADREEGDPQAYAQALLKALKFALDSGHFVKDRELESQVQAIFTHLPQARLNNPTIQSHRNAIERKANDAFRLINDYIENQHLRETDRNLEQAIEGIVEDLKEWFDAEGRNLFFNAPEIGFVHNGVWVEPYGLDLMSALFGFTAHYQVQSADLPLPEQIDDDTHWQVVKRLNCPDKSGVETEALLHENDVHLYFSHTGNNHWQACFPITQQLQQSIESNNSYKEAWKNYYAQTHGLSAANTPGRASSVLGGLGSGAVVGVIAFALGAPSVAIAFLSLVSLTGGMMAMDYWQNRPTLPPLPRGTEGLLQQLPQEKPLPKHPSKKPGAPIVPGYKSKAKENHRATAKPKAKQPTEITTSRRQQPKRKAKGN